MLWKGTPSSTQIGLRVSVMERNSRPAFSNRVANSPRVRSRPPGTASMVTSSIFAGTPSGPSLTIMSQTKTLPPGASAFRQLLSNLMASASF